jgi:glycosyltransferase involved in cell wall biosynthesis
MDKILILHYHLNPGGVTRIIESQIGSLKEHGDTVLFKLITGAYEPSGKKLADGIDITVNELINYLPEDESGYTKIYQSFREFFFNSVQNGEIIHVHNLNLGKNPILTLIISQMARKGVRVVNHVHDFAEDRPVNMKFLRAVIEGFFGENLKSIMYPELGNYLFATLTTHDQKRLMDYGVSAKRIFLLPNPVSFSEPDFAGKEDIRKELCMKLKINPDKKIITFPVRVIQRKNIGEYILLTVLFHEKANWIVTLPPLNPFEVEPYLVWKKFCEDQKIPLVFEAGSEIDFEKIMLASDLCFTTSIQEGFGMVFLEPWLFNISMMGRNIKHVTEDIIKTGIEFPLLYDRMIVNTGNKKTDFALLESQEQRKYISNSLRDHLLRDELIADNPFLGKIFNSVEQNLIQKNKTLILNEYSHKKYAERLQGIYQKFAE